MKGQFPFIPSGHIFTRPDEGLWHAQDCGSEPAGVALASCKKNECVFHVEVYFSSHVKDVPGRGSSHSVGLTDPGSSQATALLRPSNSPWLPELQPSHPSSRKQNRERAHVVPLKRLSEIAH